MGPPGSYVPSPSLCPIIEGDVMMKLWAPMCISFEEKLALTCKHAARKYTNGIKIMYICPQSELISGLWCIA